MRVRKNAQQVLLYLSPTLAKKNERFYTHASPTAPGSAGLGSTNHNGETVPYGPTLSTNSWAASPPSNSSKWDSETRPFGWRSGYKNIVPILSSFRKYPALASGVNHPDVAVSHLVSSSPGASQFFTFELTSAQQAALVPIIELYKLDYPMVQDKKGNFTGEIDREKPPTRRLIKFPKSINERELLDLLNLQGGNLGSSGIEKFTWDLKGVNPAEVHSNIEARLHVYFNNINIFNDLIAARRNGTAKTNAAASFIDLITFAPPTIPNESLPCLETYVSEYFEIEARLGWSVDTKMGDTLGFSREQMAHIEAQVVYLYLTLTDHKFDFKEDGSATLEVNYRARSTLNSRQHDILQPSPQTDKAVKELANRKKAITDDDSPTSTDKRLIEKAEKDVSRSLKKQYTLFIKSILKQVYQAEIDNTLLLNNVSISHTQAVFQPSRPNLTPQEYAEEEAYFRRTGMNTNVTMAPVGPGTSGAVSIDGRDQGGITTTTGGVSVDQLLKLAATEGAGETSESTEAYYDNAIRPIQDALRQSGLQGRGSANDANCRASRRPIIKDAAEFIRLMDNDGENNAASGDTANESLFNLGEEITAAGPGKSKINYLYLGDILEVALQTPDIVALFKNKKFTVVTTDFRFKNYFKLIAKMALTTDPGTGRKMITIGALPMAELRCKEASLDQTTKEDIYSCINMANIPINLELFLDFFTSKVVSINRQNYYLEDFLNDLFNSLVKPILGEPGILGVPMSRPTMINVNVDTTNASYPWSQKEAGIVSNRGQVPHTSIYDIDMGQGLSQGIGAAQGMSSMNYINPWSVFVPTFPSMAPPPPLPAQVFLPKPIKTEDICTAKVLGIMLQFDNLDGDYGNNFVKGIPNFLVGLDRGVVKSVSFNRVDQPYLREARTAQDKNFGIGQLRELYNADLTLYGNNLLRPGQIIYIEPNSLIFGRPTETDSAARILGLGGYHLVVDVKNQISRDGWETRVKALHMAMPALKSASSGGGQYRQGLAPGPGEQAELEEMHELSLDSFSKQLRDNFDDDEIRNMGYDPASLDSGGPPELLQGWYWQAGVAVKGSLLIDPDAGNDN